MEHTILSSNSMRTSLESIYNGSAGLNSHRKNLLERVPNSNDWASFPLDTIEIKDIAYLSAATHHEFALLRGKSRDILFHGVYGHCNFTGELLDLLRSKKLRLIAHSHPDVEHIVPSQDDRNFLSYINQESSTIISYITGIERQFTTNAFTDLSGGKTNA